MKQFILIITLLFFVHFVNAQKKKILFIGNSYTYVNDLPGTLYNIALSGQDTIVYDSSAPGGYTFQNHTNNSTTLAKINAAHWHYVILQEQSQLPSFPPSQVQTEVYPYAEILDSLIHVNYSCTKTVFYMTWGRKYGDASNCGFYPPVCTFEGMGARLRQSYLEMGDMFECPVAPVGMAWKKSRELDSTINLWSGDNSHPSVAGTYLTACVFYSTIFKKHTAGLSYISSLNPATALFLQQVADSTVFDSLATWNIGVYEPQAQFSWINDGVGIQFTNESVHATSCLWSFGDGLTDTIFSPQHIYSIPGYYFVTLVVSDGCQTDTLIQTVEVLTTGLCNDVLISEMKIYPNPVTNILNVEFPADRKATYFVELDNIDGSMINIATIQPGSKESVLTFDVSSLSKGIYFIRVDSSKGMFIEKIFKVGQ